MHPIEIAQQAYDKDFRWWFLALLSGVLIGGIVVVRYIVARGEKAEALYASHIEVMVRDMAESRANHHARYEALMAQYFKQAELLAALIATNTAIVAANTEESKQVRHYLESLQGHK